MVAQRWYGPGGCCCRDAAPAGCLECLNDPVEGGDTVFALGWENLTSAGSCGSCLGLSVSYWMMATYLFTDSEGCHYFYDYNPAVCGITQMELVLKRGVNPVVYLVDDGVRVAQFRFPGSPIGPCSDLGLIATFEYYLDSWLPPDNQCDLEGPPAVEIWIAGLSRM